MALRAASQSGLAGFTKYRSLADASGNPAFNISGMVLVKPTSATVTGGGTETVTINANGSVTATNAYTLSINGVFSADFKNYVLSLVTKKVTSGNNDVDLRFRVAGTDNSTASSYVRQSLNAVDTTISASRAAQDHAEIGRANNTAPNGHIVYFYGPFLTQPTASRSVFMENSSAGFRLNDLASTHNQSTSYDGFTLRLELGASEAVDYTLAVYGIRS
jgi:hypothetical protein